MNTPKAAPGQGRDFQIAELYQAAFKLDVSDGACRVLMALISRIDTTSGGKKFETTWVGRDWISLQIQKSKRQIHDLIEELVTTGVVSVAHMGRNKTNITRVDTTLLLKLGRAHNDQVEAQLATARKENKEREDGRIFEKLHKTDRRISATPDMRDSSTPDVSKTSADLISASNQKDLTSTVALPSATQPSSATRLAECSTPHAPPLPPQSARNFNDDQVGAWESLEATLLSKLEALRLDGHATSEQINTIHQSLMVRRYTIGAELLEAYMQGIQDTHEAQIASEWIMKVALTPTSDPRRYVTTLRAFIKGKADMFTASAESRITKQRQANAS